MDLLSIINRDPSPRPWSEGEKIPWDEPGFSARMLKEHLSQSHDAASRRFKTIDKHVAWIHNQLLSSQTTKILDLGCGPGLYTCRLAQVGHKCVGIDFSPASIAYASAFAADQEDMDRRHCIYILEDLRLAKYGSGYGLIMQIYGEFNVFNAKDARAIIRKAYNALSPGGLLLLELHNEATVQKIGQTGSTWYSSTGGLFSEKPHFCLTESFWNASEKTATLRYFIIEAATGKITRYASSTKAYSQDELCSLLSQNKFGDIRFFPSLQGKEDETQQDFFVVVARKPGKMP